MTAGQKMPAGRRKEQILKQATELFAKYGYKKVTIAMLAKSCGISDPALYRHFKSKDHIYREVLKSLKDKINLADLEAKLKKIDDIEKILFAFTTHLLNMHLTHPEMTRLLLYCSLEGHSQTRHVFEVIRIPYIELLAKTIKRLKRANKAAAVDPLLTARCFTGMVTECAIGANLWNQVLGKPIEPRKIMKNTVPIFARGLKNK